ncbi:MAG: GntG family PLP-dependent aldolase [Bacteroidota bacterium]
MKILDFRSDTVTKPSKEMLHSMFSCEVGDDVFNEDPTINLLQEKAASMFGMEAALFCSSGTQTNQIAINVHVQPGGEVICNQESHIYKYEGGGIAKNSGASVRLIEGNRGRINAKTIEEWLNPDDVHYPVTQLVSLEDTSNRGGGAIYDFEEIKRIKTLCEKNNLPLHLDGARIFNALIENGIDNKTYASQFDSISICLSKGLGTPVGSLLLGKTDFIKKARRVRKVLGGGMRQAGFLAAAGIYALDNNVSRLKTDHEHAKRLETCLLNLSWVKETIPVETNIVVPIIHDFTKRDAIIQLLAENGVKCMAFGPGMIRFVTHLDISSDDIDQTINILTKLKV